MNLTTRIIIVLMIPIMLWKLLLVLALCVHWFNPMVWVMFFEERIVAVVIR